MVECPSAGYRAIAHSLFPHWLAVQTEQVPFFLHSSLAACLYLVTYCSWSEDPHPCGMVVQVQLTLLKALIKRCPHPEAPTVHWINGSACCLVSS